MIFLRSDGTVVSRNNDTAFGWQLNDINLEIKKCKNIPEYEANSVEKQKVLQESCKCCEVNNEIVYIPPIKNITDLLDQNSEDKLLLAIIRPALWNKIYGNDVSQSTTKKQKFNFLSTRTYKSFKNSNYEPVIRKLKIYSDEPVSSLEIKLQEVDGLLQDVKEEIIEMQRTIEDLNKSYIDEETYVEDLIQRTVFYTQDIMNTTFLNNVLILLNNKFCNSAIKNWPFYSESSNSYSKTPRNYVV